MRSKLIVFLSHVEILKNHLKAVTDEKIVVIERVFFASVCMLVRQLNSEKRGRRRKTKMKCKKRANKTKKIQTKCDVEEDTSI